MNRLLPPQKPQYATKERSQVHIERISAKGASIRRKPNPKESFGTVKGRAAAQVPHVATFAEDESADAGGYEADGYRDGIDSGIDADDENGD
jgi:hypothetical protein